LKADIKVSATHYGNRFDTRLDIYNVIDKLLKEIYITESASKTK